MRVLVACEFSGRVRDAFIKRGFDAVSCDLLPSEQPGPHIRGDVLEHLNDGWDLMIAHPPCTYLSYAATSSWNDTGRVWRRLEALRLFAYLWTAPIPHVCIENPAGCASPTIAKYSQVIQPWMFGDCESKRTWLWLKELPPLVHVPSSDMFDEKTHVAPTVYAYYKTGPKKGQPIYGNNYLKFSEDRGHLRSVTFQGIADAMAQQWGSYITTNADIGDNATHTNKH